jgi:hypothetical protein
MSLSFVSRHMKSLTLFGRLLVALVIAMLFLAIALFLASEITCTWYMNHYAVASRLELSEDHGFGMLGFLVMCVTAVVLLPFTAIAGWRLSGRLQR